MIPDVSKKKKKTKVTIPTPNTQLRALSDIVKQITSISIEPGVKVEVTIADAQ